MGLESPVPEEASFRTHPLRALQYGLLGDRPTSFVDFMHRRGYYDGTTVDAVLSGGDELHADHVSITGLELLDASVDDMTSGGGIKPAAKYVWASFQDVLDGPVAKSKGQASPEGAIKDPLVDRGAEAIMAQIIATHLQRARDFLGDERCDETIPITFEQLQVAFNLSTLTKSALEMVGAEADEGGMGGMIQRRIYLFFILRNIHRLNHHIDRNNTAAVAQSIVKIEASLNTLIEGSWQRAIERARVLRKHVDENPQSWSNERLDNPHSSAATEAGKYATIIKFNNRLGVDMRTMLDALDGDDIFPPAEYLAESFDYVNPRLANIEPFLQDVITIVNRSSMQV